jgi:hypothetical protein
MILHTASEGVSLARKLETDSAVFYQALAQKYPQATAVFAAMAEENKKNITQIERSYYGVITDAIEGCFAFNLETDHFILETGISSSLNQTEAFHKSLKIEETIIRFYTEAAEQSKPLMADVPRTFALIAKKRILRAEKIKSLLLK